MAKEWEWDKDGNEKIDKILQIVVPELLRRQKEAFKEILEKARYFVSFNDLSRYIISALESKMRLSDETKEILYQELEKIYKETQMSVVKDFPIRYELNIADERAINYASKLHDFYLGKFFQGDKELRLRVVNWMSKYYLEQGNPIGKGQEGIKEFLNQFGQYLTNQTEWKARQIIDTSVNYLRNSARLRALHKAGIKKYKWNAIGDRLTCSACKSMDGRIFETQEAVRILDTIEASDDPTIIKELRPFITQPVKGPTSSIPTKTPPAHPHCRCVITAYIEEFETPLPTTVERPSKAPYTPQQRELEEEYQALTKEEISNRIKAHQGAEWGRPPADASEADIKKFLNYAKEQFEKYGKEVGAKNLEEYKKMAKEIIKNPGQVFVRRTADGKTIYAFFKNGKLVESIDDNLSILALRKAGIDEYIQETIQNLEAIIKIL